MRRTLLGTVAAFAVVMLAAGSRPETQSDSRAEPKPKDVLFLRTSEGITLVRDLPKGVTVSVPDAVPSIDWSAVVRAIPQDGATRVEAIDPASGAVLWSRDVEGRLDVKVASGDAAMVALGSPREGTGYPGGRASTTLVILGEGTSEPRTVELDGNYEPEAFSTDGRSLFVVEYLPPRDPTSYRVRRLDLRTEEVVGVYTVDEELQESMQGTARVQAASPDGRRLYTLYTLEGAEGGRRAFVHVLSLDELWAHCIDLPPSFGTADERAMAISVSPDGGRLYVADAATGTVAEADTGSLAVTRTTQAAFGSRGGIAHAVAGPDGMLYLGKGTGLVALDASTWAPGRSWDMDERITGLQTANDGGRLYVGLKDQIVIVDAATGERLGVLDPAGLGTIDQLGRSTRSLGEVRTEIECAC
ncbi:MAG: YncE family protein [Actinomycetota bacterium]